VTELLIPGISEVPEETCNKLAQLAIQSKYTDYRSMRLLYYLVMALEPKTVVELGTFLGASTAHLAAGLKAGKVLSIDKYLYTSLNDVHETLSTFDFTCDIELCKADTFACEPHLPPNIDLLFMDAAHEYGSLILEFEQVRYKLANSHVLVIDDIFLQGIMQFVDEISQQRLFTIKLPFHNGVAILCSDMSMWNAVSQAVRRANV
jgi:predicted O-methyltransferase YrrM